MKIEGFIDVKLLKQFLIGKLHIPAEEAEIKGIIHRVLNHLFQVNNTDYILNKRILITQAQTVALEQIIERLNNQEPVQYVLGNTDFYGLELKVNPNVLIPRPETEELVDLIIKENSDTQLKILDVGTGSGCIAIAIQKNLKEAEVYAIDISPGALAIAIENATINSCTVKFIQTDVFSELPPLPHFDIVVSNPPYVLEKEKDLMKRNVLEFEPYQALFVPDHNPLLYYKRIISIAENLLRDGGKLYFEINERFGAELAKLIRNQGFEEVTIIKDMQGKDRIIRGKR